VADTLKRFSLKRIKELCIQYDKLRGQYPETVYEGMGVYLFLAANSEGGIRPVKSFDPESLHKAETFLRLG
jgi:hypothetical protein